MTCEPIALFALNATRSFGEQVAQHFGVALSEHEEREFEDGEHKSRPLVSMRGYDVFVIQSLYDEPAHSVNDKLCRLLFFIGCLKDANAARVTAVVPYLCYARKDRKTQPRDPVTTRYLASLFEAVGTDRVVTLEVHNLAAFQNAFRCRTEHLSANKLFVNHFAQRLGNEELTVVSPDAGGIKRAEQFRLGLGHRLGEEITSAFMEKYRALGVVSGAALVGNVAGKVAIIIDDMVGSGSTLLRAAQACLAQGATKVYAVASHGLFLGGAPNLFGSPALEKTIVTNTVPPFRVPPEVIAVKLEVLDTAPLFAAAIKAMHSNGSLVELLEH